jgi:hypothetical protein
MVIFRLYVAILSTYVLVLSGIEALWYYPGGIEGVGKDDKDILPEYNMLVANRGVLGCYDVDCLILARPTNPLDAAFSMLLLWLSCRVQHMFPC